ncbi:hypothetical protein H9L12_08020 [Sphingomonas rhizophila]|uniref:Uncharacterized protein n=1 Tax=Sphingomonas rhizophila TaxID=2071607 RepID=A0A7G9S8W9_9SPHN|nr:hypothetical protein [Sphingomonas rhizophila]QNN64294.1 hypothetical protein H9L12_08020 [Sphingomonas rhizophila]
MTDDPKREPHDPSEDEHPLASPTELAGTTEAAIDAEFAARGRQQALEIAEKGEPKASEGNNPG